MEDIKQHFHKIILGDCLEKLKELEDNSVDSIVTDPPYGLGFMGKEWDTFDKSQFGKKGEEGENDLKVKKNFNILPRYNTDGLYEFSRDWAKECYRVLKPGGYILAFAGTRTYHKITMGIEDAGFEVRDMIEWVYGSGFPKSLNIGKTVDKLRGNEREVVGRNPNSRENCDKSNTLYESGTVGKTDFITKGTSEWEGWGTALKPAHEPICMARKPLAEKTVAENVLKYGTGGINIDESRVFTTDNTAGKTSMTAMGQNSGWNAHENKEVIAGGHELGRFPANLIHNGSDEVVECFPNESERFFKSIIYQAKASKSERNKGCEGLEKKQYSHDGRDKEIENPYQRNKSVATNNHPTVKPIALMEYLIKMVTPKGGIVLDPFAGSGSTLVAAKQNGFQYIGIEMTEEYIPIIESRLNTIRIDNTLF